MKKLLEAIKSAYNAVIETGLRLPHAYDPVSKEASFRLLCAYISFVLACVSIVALHFSQGLFTATATAIGFYALCMIFYMLKKLVSAKIDLDDKEISLNSESDEK